MAIQSDYQATETEKERKKEMTAPEFRALKGDKRVKK